MLLFNTSLIPLFELPLFTKILFPVALELLPILELETPLLEFKTPLLELETVIGII